MTTPPSPPPLPPSPVGPPPAAAAASSTSPLGGCVLAVLCLPLALLAVVLYPIAWVLFLPLMLVLDLDLGDVFELLYALLTLPARMLRRARGEEAP